LGFRNAKWRAGFGRLPPWVGYIGFERQGMHGGDHEGGRLGPKTKPEPRGSVFGYEMQIGWFLVVGHRCVGKKPKTSGVSV